MDAEDPGDGREDGLARGRRPGSIAPGYPGPAAKYDRTLELEREETLIGSIAFALKGLARLDSGTRSALHVEAAALGISPDRADRLIARCGRNLGVSLDAGLASSENPAAHSESRQRIDPVSLSEVPELWRPDRLRAGGPGRSRGIGLSALPGFASLGLPTLPTAILDRRAAVRLWVPAHGPRAFDPPLRSRAAGVSRSDFHTAHAELERVQEIAPAHVGARKGLGKVRQRVAEIEGARAALARALAGARLVAARKALAAWERLVDPAASDVSSARETLARAWRDAEALAARARLAEQADPATARSLYRQALALASDWPEARAGLSRCPPDPPRDLAAELAGTGDRVRLYWTPPVDDDLGPVSFAVLRKPGGLPAHPGDGLKIADVNEPTFEDAGVVSGQTYSFAVRSVPQGESPRSPRSRWDRFRY